MAKTSIRVRASVTVARGSATSHGTRVCRDTTGRHFLSWKTRGTFRVSITILVNRIDIFIEGSDMIT